MVYIKHAGQLGCIFCAALKRRDGPGNLVLWRSDAGFVLLNRYPYNAGHLMIAPRRHVGRINRLSDLEQRSMWSLAADAQAVLDRALKPHGYNLGVNLGRVAGAGVPGHLHLHIVPRWTGDTNFMPLIGRTKVMPISLAEMYRRLRRVLPK